MVEDIRLSIGFLDHPKTIKLKRLLGWEGVESLMRLWFFAAQYKTSGVFKGMDEVDLEIAAGWTGEPNKFLDTIINLKFLEKNAVSNAQAMPYAYALHNWKNRNAYVAHSSSRSEIARNAARVRWQKSNKNQHVNADSNANAYADRNAPSPAPTPAPAPTPVPIDNSNTIISIPLINRDGVHHVSENDFSQYKDTYPAIDILQELKKCKQWNSDNPSNRKTKNGIRKHISGWLSRAQDRAPKKAILIQDETAPVKDPSIPSKCEICHKRPPVEKHSTLGWICAGCWPNKKKNLEKLGNLVGKSIDPGPDEEETKKNLLDQAAVLVQEEEVPWQE